MDILGKSEILKNSYQFIRSKIFDTPSKISDSTCTHICRNQINIQIQTKQMKKKNRILKTRTQNSNSGTTNPASYETYLEK